MLFAMHRANSPSENSAYRLSLKPGKEKIYLLFAKDAATAQNIFKKNDKLWVKEGLKALE